MPSNRHLYAPVLALRPQVWLLISTILYFFPFAVGSFEYQTHYGPRYLAYHSATGFAVGLAFATIILSLFIRNKRIDFSVTGNFRHERIAIVCFIVVFGLYTLLTPGLFEAR